MEENDNEKLNEWVVTISRPWETSIHVEARTYDDAEKLAADIASRLPLCVFEDTGATTIESVKMVHHEHDDLVEQIFGKRIPPDMIFRKKSNHGRMVKEMIRKLRKRRRENGDEE